MHPSKTLDLLKEVFAPLLPPLEGCLLRLALLGVL
jgi:hypothetical protein